MRIYEIEASIEEALQLYEQGYEEVVDTETGEVKSLADYIDELQLSKEEKIKNLALYVKNKSAFLDALKLEKKRIADKMERESKQLESAMEYLRTVTNGKSVKDPQYTISYRKSEAVEISEGAVIPEEFLVPQEPKVSKTELKKALKAGAIIEGVSIIEKQNMSVK